MIKKLLLLLLVITGSLQLFASEEYSHKILILHGRLPLSSDRQKQLQTFINTNFKSPIKYTIKQYDPAIKDINTLNIFDAVIYCIDAGSGTRLSANPQQHVQSLAALKDVPHRALVIFSYGENCPTPATNTYQVVFPNIFSLCYTLQGLCPGGNNQDFIKWLKKNLDTTLPK